MEQRNTIVAGNWKMYKTIPQALEWARSFQKEQQLSNKVELVLFPPFTALHALSQELHDSLPAVGAQDIYPGNFGAFTGEVSGSMLRDAGAKWVLIGHSERRQYFGERHELLADKLYSALEWGLKPVYCVGETLGEREGGSHFEVVGNQIRQVLQGLDEEASSKVVVAYEPVWAIGTGKTATTLEAEEMHGFIRSEVKAIWGRHSESVPIIYGGSVKPANAAELFQCPNIDGALVGGASLDPQEFLAIARSVPA